MDKELSRTKRLSEIDSEDKLAQKKIKALEERSNQQEEIYIVMTKGEYLYPDFFKGPKRDWAEYTKSLMEPLAKKIIDNYKAASTKEKEDWKIKPLLCNLKKKLLELIKKDGYRECPINDFVKGCNIPAIKVNAIPAPVNYKGKSYWETEKNIYVVVESYAEKTKKNWILSVPHTWRSSHENEYTFDQYSTFRNIGSAHNYKTSGYFHVYQNEGCFYATKPIPKITFDDGLHLVDIDTSSIFDYYESTNEQRQEFYKSPLFFKMRNTAWSDYLMNLGLSKETAKKFIESQR